MSAVLNLCVPNGKEDTSNAFLTARNISDEVINLSMTESDSYPFHEFNDFYFVLQIPKTLTNKPLFLEAPGDIEKNDWR